MREPLAKAGSKYFADEAAFDRGNRTSERRRRRIRSRAACRPIPNPITPALTPAARRVRRALPCVRAGRQVSLRRRPQLHAARCAGRKPAQAARAARHFARGHRARQLPWHGHGGHVGCDRLEPAARYRGVACVEDGVTDARTAAPARGRHSRHSLQFRQAPGRCAGPRRVLPAAGAHQALGLACRAALRCRGHPDASRSCLGRIDVPFIIDHMGRVKAADGLQQRAVSIAARTVPQQSLWRGSRSAAPSGYRSASGRFATPCRSRGR